MDILLRLPASITEWTHVTVREAVLELLREISQSKLSKLCQISQPLLSSIVNNKHEGKIGKKKCEEFGRWYCEYRKTHTVGDGGSASVSKDTVIGDSEGTTESGGDARITFHSSEVQQLRNLYRVNPKPSDRMFLKYADMINQGSVRQERLQVTVKSLKNWWKNERQRERKTYKQSAKTTKSKRSSKVKAQQLLSNTDDVRQSSDDEPTLTVAFHNEDIL